MFPPGEGPTNEGREKNYELYEGLEFRQGIKSTQDYRLRADLKSMQRGIQYWYGGMANP